MPSMPWWDWMLLGVGAYVAVVTLVKLMRQRREELYAELSRQAAAEQHRKRIEEKKKKKREAAGKAA